MSLARGFLSGVTLFSRGTRGRRDFVESERLGGNEIIEWASRKGGEEPRRMVRNIKMMIVLCCKYNGACIGEVKQCMLLYAE